MTIVLNLTRQHNNAAAADLVVLFDDGEQTQVEGGSSLQEARGQQDRTSLILA